MLKKLKKRFVQLVVIGVVGLGGIWFYGQVAPTASGAKIFYRVEKPKTINRALEELESKGVVKNAFAAKLYATVASPRKLITPGVYQLKPGMALKEVFNSLASPLKQLVRIPEGRWLSRVGKVLESKQVVKAEEYIALAEQPEKFKEFPLVTSEKSLEGFLYPDTYNFPPTVGADLIIKRQLLNFAQKTKGLGLTKENVHRILTIASMLELESNKLDEKQMISGVIENRIKQGMRLQIDATVNYGMQEWRVLNYVDYTRVKSPYNTYLAKGLPPGPICSPTIDSIKAAMTPTKHPYVYYISLPNGKTLFSKTYAEHLANVKVRDNIKKAQQAKTVSP